MGKREGGEGGERGRGEGRGKDNGRRSRGNIRLRQEGLT